MLKRGLVCFTKRMITNVLFATKKRIMIFLKVTVIVLVVDTDLLQKTFFGDITSKGNIVLIGYCLICDRRKTTIVSDNTLHAERLIDFVQNLRKKGINLSKKMA